MGNVSSLSSSDGGAGRSPAPLELGEEAVGRPADGDPVPLVVAETAVNESGEETWGRSDGADLIMATSALEELSAAEIRPGVELREE